MKKIVAIAIARYDPPTLSDMAICSHVLKNHSQINEYWYVPCGDDTVPLNNRVEMLSTAVQDFFPECKAIKVYDHIAQKTNYKANAWSVFEEISKLNPQYEFFIVTTLFDFTKELPLLNEQALQLTQKKLIIVGNELDPKMKELGKKSYSLLNYITNNTQDVKTRLHDINRDSTFDSCKALSLVSKIVLQYIVSHKYYL